MKNLLTFSSSKILMLCGLGLVLTLGSFWHYQVNQVQVERMNVLNQGASTCFNRISQTFTAMMIKDIKSPYLNQGFMSLSDECLSETIKGMNPFKREAGKGFDILNKLITEVHWFHEKVIKIHAPMLAGKNLDVPMGTLLDRYAKMENYKMNLLDEVESTNSQIKQVQNNDEFLMGTGLIMFVIALAFLALKEFNRIQTQNKIEREALNLLKAGQSNMSAMVDRLVEKSLLSQGFQVTAQIFKDYHENILERSSNRIKSSDSASTKALVTHSEIAEEQIEEEEDLNSLAFGPNSSLKELVVSLQNIYNKDIINTADTRDVNLAVDFESFEQLLNASVSFFATRRESSKKIMISNQIHSDRSIVNVFLAGATFTASELECSQGNKAAYAEISDVNLMIMKEMALETETQFNFENKINKSGTIIGMQMKLIVKRVPKERKTKNLVSVVKGKKKDLARELSN